MRMWNFLPGLFWALILLAQPSVVDKAGYGPDNQVFDSTYIHKVIVHLADEEEHSTNERALPP